MRNNLCFIILMVFTTINAQKVEKDFNNFYSGNNKHKPIKYVLFEIEKDNESEKKNNGGKIYFYVKSERFVFDMKKHKKDTCSIDILKTIKLENSRNLQNDEYEYFRKKVDEFEKKTKQKIPKALPISQEHLYFKVYVIEKISSGKIVKYEVDWEYSNF
ncbi:hypothetical protein GON26_14480 [Flavobacterium sp. GA093]|uniref:Uncharacterized protein n=1 Tax=Flavobacterium hydrocarbonoxydans TaxID=2683249 RepID=A0A6I4NRG2_9FLAO|nr:hypothetical protein [Flavobacterium hydrocarbonoxydans]MWB95572.1 hypothetical protein [Flavobacterium hydrocarbonoxydans]